MSMTTRTLAELLQGDLEGDGDIQIANVAGLTQAGASDLTFAENIATCAEAFASPAGAVLVPRRAPASTKTLIRVDNCREAFAHAMAIFHPPRQFAPGVDPSARVSPDVQLGVGVHVGAHVMIAVGARIGDHTVITSNCAIGEGARLGAGCLLHPNVTVYAGVKIGDRVTVHAGTVIGSDGFGYVRTGTGIAKVPQIGDVVIGDDVELGACVTIDRAMMDSTIIGAGTKIDNQVQIAHNVIIGRQCLIAGMTGIAGSVRLGDYVTLAGAVSVVDHVEIGARAVVGAGSLVTKDVPAGEVVWGSPARRAREAKRESAATRRLPGLLRELRAIRTAAAGESADLVPPARED